MSRLLPALRVLPAVLLLPACTPVTPLRLPVPEAGEDSVVLLIHGGGDSPREWAADLARRVEAELVAPERWQVIALDWETDADDALTAAARGRELGAGLAGQLADQDTVQLHLVAHSVGAHLAHGVATSLPADDRPDLVQLTLLDPFVGTGLVRWSYGRSRFGEGADFAEAYVNTDDGVPSTDGLLDRAHVFDLTDLRPDAVDSSTGGHRFPVAWYARSADSGLGLDLALGTDGDAAWAAFPPGGVTELE